MFRAPLLWGSIRDAEFSKLKQWVTGKYWNTQRKPFECTRRPNTHSLRFMDLSFPPPSYVAVTGLPVPRNDHALVMSRFAGDCITMMTRTTNELEPQLGPDTGDLKIRIGLNR